MALQLGESAQEREKRYEDDKYHYAYEVLTVLVRPDVFILDALDAADGRYAEFKERAEGRNENMISHIEQIIPSVVLEKCHNQWENIKMFLKSVQETQGKISNLQEQISDLQDPNKRKQSNASSSYLTGGHNQPKSQRTVEDLMNSIEALETNLRGLEDRIQVDSEIFRNAIDLHRDRLRQASGDIEEYSGPVRKTTRGFGKAVSFILLGAALGAGGTLYALKKNDGRNPAPAPKSGLVPVRIPDSKVKPLLRPFSEEQPVVILDSEKSITPVPIPEERVSPVATSEEQAQVVPASRTYTVVSGDSLSGIANAYSVSVEALMATNGISSSRNILSIGKELKIPETGQGVLVFAPRTHTVVSGDSLSKISYKYGVTIDSIRDLNGIPRTSNLIRIGESLKIPGRSVQNQ